MAMSETYVKKLLAFVKEQPGIETLRLKRKFPRAELLPLEREGKLVYTDHKWFVADGAPKSIVAQPMTEEQLRTTIEERVRKFNNDYLDALFEEFRPEIERLGEKGDHAWDEACLKVFAELAAEYEENRYPSKAKENEDRLIARGTGAAGPAYRRYL